MTDAQAAGARTTDLTDRGEARELALKALMTADQFLSSAEQELPGIAEALSRNELETVRTPLSQLLDGLGALTQLAADLQTLVGPDSAADARIDHGELSAALEELVRAQEGGDWPAVGTVLSERIGPVLSSMRASFDRRAETLQTL